MINEITQLIQLVGVGIALMLPLANPLTSMTMLLSLGQHIPFKERQRQIRQAAFYVVGIMLVAYYAGSFIMSTFGISIPGLRMAGGLIVVAIGFNMLFPKHAVGDTREAKEAKNEAVSDDGIPNIAFVPLALPGTAGPGTIAMIVSAASTFDAQMQAHYAPWILTVTPVIVFSVMGLIFFVCLRSAGRIVSMIGQDGVEAIARIMGFLLVCMGIQFMINGVVEVVTELAPQLR